MKIKDTCSITIYVLFVQFSAVSESHQVSQTERNGMRGRCKVPIISIRPPSLNSN